MSWRISPRTSTVILRDRSPRATAVATSAMLRTCPVRFEAMELTLSVKILPGAGHAGHLRLAAQLAFGADFARHAGDFRGEGVQLVHHRVDGFLELREFRRCTSTVIFFDRSPLAMAVATSAMLRTWAVRLRGHGVDAVGQVLPGAGHAAHVGLAAELAFGADFARHAGDFAGESVELVHHGVDGFLELQDFAADVRR